ncbi:MAG: ParA family protein [Candidatus Liptonbacteria bacterium]|nr:ParA family protein [Candidatus Liptonbacteria bacterium]
MARVIALCNQKGGVGKTTTAVNLAAYLAALGRKTLLVDFDPQGNASSGLGHAVALEGKSVYHGIAETSRFEELRRECGVDGLHCLPANQHLAGLLIELVSVPDREYRLRKFVNQFRHAYDYILIDLPPSLSLLTINGLVAADEVIIPVQAEYYSLEGIGQLLETIELIRQNLRHGVRVAGAVITMHDKRERLSREVAKNLRRFFPFSVFETEIPRSISLAEAPSFGKPVILYNPQSPGGKAYEQLARELIGQESVGRRDGNFNIK